MKKKLAILAAVLFSFMAFCFLAVNVNAEEPENTEPEVVETLPCKVLVEDMAYGDLIVDIEEGNIGDKVTIYAKPYTFCSLISISVNGTQLVADEDGNYSFLLVEGDNLIVAEFGLDNAQLEGIADLIANAKKGKWSDIFNVTNMLAIVYWVFTTLITSGFLITLLKHKTIKSKTKDEVVNITSGVIKETNAEAIEKFLVDMLAPLMNKLNLKIDNVSETCKVLARCLAFAQNEDKMAIIKELTELGNKDDEKLFGEIKAMINDEIIKQQEIQNAKVKAIEDLEKANNELVKEETKNEENGEGRIEL